MAWPGEGSVFMSSELVPALPAAEAAAAAAMVLRVII